MLVLFFLLWVIFNGNFTLEICIFGAIISVTLFTFVCKFMDFSLKKELHIYKKSFLFVRYVFLLIKEIVKANFGVIRMILNQREEVQPMLVTFHSDLKTTTGKAFLANAITLTPGTITVSLEKDQYTVHCLDESLAEGMDNSEFVTYIKKLEE
ncbi:MAG: Na+/H+ antiporter subunit E [Acetatifactor sp.]|nr:Na+/H+ antiporter subunit E [Acetatifactor sp.]